jgi:hypothetical protein
MKKIIIVAISVTLSLFSIPAQANLKNKTLAPTLAILDSALDASIPEIKSKLIQEVCILDFPSCPNGRSFMQGSGSSYLPSSILSTNSFSHGTQMASIAIASNPNMNIIFVRIIGNTSSGGRQTTGPNTLPNALSWVLANKDKYNIVAVSVSQGSQDALKKNSTQYCPVSTTDIAIDKLYSAGIPTFFPAGNNRDRNKINWPACIPNSVAVGGVEPYGEISTFSNYDKNLIDMWAPITSKAKYPGNTQGNSFGTSVSTQIAASQYVALKNANPNLSLDKILSIIKETAKPIKNSLGQEGLLFDLKSALSYNEINNSNNEKISFNNIVNSISKISSTVWNEINLEKNIKHNGIESELQVAPNIVINQDLVSSQNYLSMTYNLWKKHSQPSKINIFIYDYDNLNWMSNKIKLLPGSWLKSDHLVDMCPSINKCNSYGESFNGKAQIFLGLTQPRKPLSNLNSNLAHEYTHSVQYNQFNKNTPGYALIPCWLSEGQAQLSGFAVSSSSQYEYEINRNFWLSRAAGSLGNYDYKTILNFYSLAGSPKSGSCDNKIKDKVYDVGYISVEALSAIGGINSTMEIIINISKGYSFEESFSKVYNISWKNGSEILARVVSSQFNI